MIYISHRGYFNGSDKDLENNPKQIEFLYNKNYDIEVDVRFYKNKFYLGHDEPKYEINHNFLENEKLWCHAKNHETLEELSCILIAGALVVAVSTGVASTNAPV